MRAAGRRARPDLHHPPIRGAAIPAPGISPTKMCSTLTAEGALLIVAGRSNDEALVGALSPRRALTRQEEDEGLECRCGPAAPASSGPGIMFEKGETV